MNKDKEEFTPPDGGYGWVIIFSTTLINICAMPLVQCFGLIYENDFKNLGINAAQTSLLLHLHTAIYCSLGLLASPLLKKYDFRRVAIFGTSLMSFGIFLTSFAPSYAVLICTFPGLIGLGQGIMLPATYLATNTYFKKRLTLAMSFSVTGVSVMYIFMPQICERLLSSFNSTRSTVLVLAALSVVAVAACFLLKPIQKKTDSETTVMQKLNTQETEDDVEVEKKEPHSSTPQDQVYKETTLPRNNDTFLHKMYKIFDLELLKHRPYVIAIIGMSISFASELNIVLMIPFILTGLAGFDSKSIAWALSIQSIADIFGRLGISLVAHCLKIPPRIMYSFSLITATVGRTVLAICYDSKTTIYFCCCLLGLAKGTKAVYQSVIIPRYVSLEKIPAANGLNMVLSGSMSLSIGPLLGVISDNTHSFVYALHAASVISMSCVLLWVGYYITSERKKEDCEGDEK